MQTEKKFLSIPVEQELLERLDTIQAEGHDGSRATVARRAIYAGLADLEKPRTPPKPSEGSPRRGC
jgi:hypothetical protein